MVTTIVVYLLIFVYLASDARLRSGEKAKSIKTEQTDQKSTRYLGLAFLIAILLLLLSPLLAYFKLGQMGAGGWFLGWCGVIMMLLGIGLRAWATQALGRFYTRTLLTTDDQHVVQEGPYKWVRHPGYAGSLLVWVGAGLAVSNWFVFTIVTLVVCSSYLYRLQSEEGMLKAKFGREYEDYMQRTRRIIPFIF